MNERKIKTAVLISGGGTNLQALIDAQKSGIIKHAEICAVISNRADAYGLERAEKAGIPHYVVEKEKAIKDPSGKPDEKDSRIKQADFERKIVEILKSSGAELIVLAGLDEERLVVDFHLQQFVFYDFTAQLLIGQNLLVVSDFFLNFVIFSM